MSILFKMFVVFILSTEVVTNPLWFGISFSTSGICIKNLFFLTNPLTTGILLILSIAVLLKSLVVTKLLTWGVWFPISVILVLNSVFWTNPFVLGCIIFFQHRDFYKCYFSVLYWFTLIKKDTLWITAVNTTLFAIKLLYLVFLRIFLSTTTLNFTNQQKQLPASESALLVFKLFELLGAFTSLWDLSNLSNHTLKAAKSFWADNLDVSTPLESFNPF